MIPFLVFTPLAFVLLSLTLKLRFRTLLIASLVIGLIADMMVDVLLHRS